MKLLYAANIRIPTPRAHGYQIMKMCERFAAHGLKVELLSSKKKNVLVQDPFVYYGLDRNFSVKKMPAPDFLGRRRGNFFFFWLDYAIFLAAFWFGRYAQRTDIVYTRDYLLSFCVPPEKLCLEIHDIPRRSKLFPAAVKRARKIIVITGGLKEELIKRGAVAEKILIAPDAVDLAEFDIDISQEEARKKLDLPPDKKIVLYTGHFYPWKGAGVLAKAAAFLPPEVLVLLVGSTPEGMADFKKYCGSAHNISFRSFQKRNKMPFYLKAADILVLPNRRGSAISEKYTSPMKMFEYMAAGRPIVASDLPSLREILNKQNAFLVEPDSPQSLANGIKELLSNGVLAKDLADKSLAEVKKYTWQERAGKIAEFIR
jgi:glycosyltransferase involved in cell wall biosynthesis